MEYSLCPIAKYWNLFCWLCRAKQWIRTNTLNHPKNLKLFLKQKSILLQKNNNNKCMKNKWCMNNNMEMSNTFTNKKLKKSLALSEKPAWTRRRLPTMLSCWQTGSLFSRWRRRRHGRRSRRPSAKQSRSCKSDNETRRTAPAETKSGERGSKRRRNGYIIMHTLKRWIGRIF